ncbi:uncharacterized protein LOC106640200 [Copidosoma floridanum]|uniref:uncharacterized protein LOC106640200 n=1 Tax=Copidosoma floridanum TaxID=29053 RepID=UPI0006C97AC1|nr:uncharacterized protein LOC106640200 [Copidosoma floridanum]
MNLESLLSKYWNYKRLARLLLPPVDCYRFLSKFVGLSLLMLSFTALNCYYVHVTDVARLTRGFSWCLSNWTMLMKVILFVVHRDRLLAINESLDQTLDGEPKSLLESLLLQRLSVYYTMIIALAMACSLFAFMITERKFLLVYPFGLLYYLIYGYEALLAGLLFRVSCGTDAAFGLWVFQLSAQLRLLALWFGKFALDIRQWKHETLIRCHDHPQRVFSLIVIWLYVTIALVLCECLHKLSKMPVRCSFWQSVVLWTFATKFLQAFTCAYCGSLVESEVRCCHVFFRVLALFEVELKIFRAKRYGARFTIASGTTRGDRRIMSDVLSLLVQRPIDLSSYNNNILFAFHAHIELGIIMVFRPAGIFDYKRASAKALDPTLLNC